MDDKMNEGYWKDRFEKLQQAMVETVANFDQGQKSFEVPEEPIWMGDEVYVANDLSASDNEEYALDVWGKGKYRKFVLDKS